LESRQDFLNLPTGKKISVPFEQIILFSTNLQPEQLVDEAFLRRVPFKINIGDPPIEEFLELFRRECESNEISWRPDVIEKLIAKHYRAIGRPLRRCHPRDLFHQVKCLCAYRGERLDLRPEYLDLACKNYFGNQPIFASSASALAPPVGWDVPKTNRPVIGATTPLPTAQTAIRTPQGPFPPISQSNPNLRTEVIGNSTTARNVDGDSSGQPGPQVTQRIPNAAVPGMARPSSPMPGTANGVKPGPMPPPNRPSVPMPLPNPNQSSVSGHVAGESVR
jgi:hypothetical protein